MKLNNLPKFLFCWTLVACLGVKVKSDDGFLDDFFTRFPHLPFTQIHPAAADNGGYFKTLYSMHKNQRGPDPDEDDDEINYRNPKLVQKTKIEKTTWGLGSERSSDDLQSLQIVPFSSDESDDYDEQYQTYVKPPVPVKRQQHFYYGKTPQNQNVEQNFRAKKSFVANFPKTQMDLPPEQMYNSPESIGPNGAVDNFQSNFETKKINFKQENIVAKRANLNQKHIGSKRMNFDQESRVLEPDFQTEVEQTETETPMNDEKVEKEKKPTSYQTISFGPIPSTNEEVKNFEIEQFTDVQQDSLNEENLENVGKNVPNIQQNIQSFDFDESFKNDKFEEVAEMPEDEKLTNTNRVVSFGEDPQQPLISQIGEPNVSETPSKSNSEQAPVNPEAPSSYQIISFGESPQETLFDDMKDKNKKVKKEIASFVGNPQQLDTVQNQEMSPQIVPFEENEPQTEMFGQIQDIFGQDNPTSYQQLTFGNIGQNEMVEHVPEVVEQDVPTSYQQLTFGKIGQNEMVEQVQEVAEQDVPTSYQQLTFGKIPSKTTKHEMSMKPIKPHFQVAPFGEMIEQVRPKQTSAFLMDNFEENPYGEINRPNNPSAFTNFEEKPLDDMFDQMNKMVDENTRPSSYQIISFGDNFHRPMIPDKKKIKKAIHYKPIGYNKNPVQAVAQQQTLQTEDLRAPASYQYVNFGDTSPSFKDFSSTIEEISSPVLQSQFPMRSDEEIPNQEVRQGSGFRDDFRSVVEMKVRQNRFQDKRSLKSVATQDFGLDNDNFSPMTESHLFGQNFPEIHRHFKEVGKKMVVVDPLEGFRKPVETFRSPKTSQFEVSKHQMSNREPFEEIVVGKPLRVQEHFSNPQVTFRAPIENVNQEEEEELRPVKLPIEEHPPPGLVASSPKDKRQNPPFQIDQQEFNHFEVEDAKLKFGPADPKIPNLPANPHFNPPLSKLVPPQGPPQGSPDFDYPDLEKPLEPVKNIDSNNNDDEGDLLGDSFPDFFKLRPQTVLEPDLTFMEELEKSKFELEKSKFDLEKTKFDLDEHDHAKREQPHGHGPVHANIVHPEPEVSFHVTESGEPLTVHPRPHVELQLQRPFDHVTPSSVRGRKNPMRKLIQGWTNVFKNGMKINPKFIRRLPKLRLRPGHPRGHFGPGKRNSGGVGDSVVVFEAEALTDSNVFAEDDFTSEAMKKKMDSNPVYKAEEKSTKMDANPMHKADKEIMKMSPTNGKRNDKLETTTDEQQKNSNREPKMMLYEDESEDYYDDLGDELSVNERLQNLFKKEFDDKFFQK